MRKISIAAIMAILSTLLVVTAAYALISNGGFETGDFTNWTKASFINNGFNIAHGSGGSDFTTIVGGPAVAPLSLSDPFTGGSLKYPAYGHYSAKVNNEHSYDTAIPIPGNVAQNGNTIDQTYIAVLDPSDNQAHVRFTYAAVMVNPTNHTPENKPYFRVQVINLSRSNDLIYDFSSYVGEPGKNWKTGIAFDASDFWQYLDWTYVDIASTAAHPVSAGDQISVMITAAGCALGGHPGYVYVDEISDGGIGGPTVQASGPATAAAGGPITYTYTYKNGSGSAINPTIVIVPPTDVTFTSLGDPGHCSGLNPVTCNFTGVPGGGTRSFPVSGTIAPAAAGTTLAHGDYTITATGFPTIGGQTVLTVVPTANLTLSASGATTVKPGDQYVYTFNYTTDSLATNTSVAFTLPGHTTFVSNTGGYTCIPAAGVVTCTLGLISANGSFDITVLLDKLKKVGTPLTLNTTDYSITGTSIPVTNGTTTVMTSVITPFADVPLGHWALDYIQSVWAAGITNGCLSLPLSYCPDANTTREEMAAYIERGIHGGSYDPPVVPLSYSDTSGPYQYWIEALKADNITSGCAPTAFCPRSSITRAQISIFLLRGKFGSAHIPPAATGLVWIDVPISHWAAGWAEELGNLGITVGCGGGAFCPESTISRAQTAVFVERTFVLPLPTP